MNDGEGRLEKRGVLESCGLGHVRRGSEAVGTGSMSDALRRVDVGGRRGDGSRFEGDAVAVTARKERFESVRGEPRQKRRKEDERVDLRHQLLVLKLLEGQVDVRALGLRLLVVDLVQRWR
jgi:hypothetical protein